MSAHLLDRRQFLALSGVALSAQPFRALACRGPETKTPEGGPPADIGYGPLQLVNDQTTGLPLLYLPYGFQYLSFGWAGDPLAGGLVTPGRHDGMAAFAGSGSLIRLVRNHEMFSGTAFASQPVYDVNGGGGTTTLEFDTATGAVLDSWASLAGTAVNCAGGLTPWGSWLSCEETVSGPGGDNGYEHPHGYIFEVPANGTATAEPLVAMGRFVHEAICVDPATGIVYETEDQGEAGFYRFLPAEVGNLAAGGQLEMLAIAGTPQADTRIGKAGNWAPVSWVPIDDPDPAETTASSVFRQGYAGVVPALRGSRVPGTQTGESTSCQPAAALSKQGKSGNTTPGASGSVSSSSHRAPMCLTCQTTSVRVPAGAWSCARTAQPKISYVASLSMDRSFPLPRTM